MSAFKTVRAGALATAFVAILLNADAHAAAYVQPDNSAATGFAAPVGDEPFGLSTSTLTEGPLRAKWLAVAKTIAAEADVIAACAGDREHCASQPALRFLDIVSAGTARDGLARLGEVNRAINLAIRPVSDRAQYGQEDHWSSPLVTLESGAGDCEDYAIAKLVALRAAGVPENDLRLVIIRETATGDDHAVVAARSGGRWRVLDNRTFLMVEDNGFGKYRPLFAIDAEGAKRFEQPVFANAAEPRPAETAAQDPVADASIPVIGSNTAMLAAEDFWTAPAM